MSKHKFDAIISYLEAADHENVRGWSEQYKSVLYRLKFSLDNNGKLYIGGGEAEVTRIAAEHQEDVSYEAIQKLRSARPVVLQIAAKLNPKKIASRRQNGRGFHTTFIQ